MSFEKAIAHGKEHRKQYPPGYSARYSAECRNHGWCEHCLSGRTHRHKRQLGKYPLPGEDRKETL